MSPSARSALAALVLVLAACGLRPALAPDAERGGAAPVGLVTEGSAFERPGLRQDVLRAVERASGRRVLPLGATASVEEAGVKALAARLVQENPGLGRYDWREPHCGAHADVLTALQRGVDAIYRVSLDATERVRPATDAERAHGGSGLFRALHLVDAGTARDEGLSGRVEMVAFVPDGVRRVEVSRLATTVEPSALSGRVDAGEAVAASLAALPAPPAPEWDAVARELLTARCPFLALAVYDTRLRPTGADAAVKKTALAAVARRGARARAARPAAPPPPEDVVSEADGEGREEKYSCTALCNMHMVQLCNNDKILWSFHRARWESTPCGARRDEDFLQDCYQHQWLSSTFRDACLRPCEDTPDGRERLLRVLRDAGCVRLDPS